MFKYIPLWRIAFVLLLVSTVFFPLTLRAQTIPITLSIAVPEYIGNNFALDLFSQFETDHPGVTVNIVKSGNDFYYPPAAFDKDKFASGAANYVRSADVLYIDSYRMSEEATRGGYFLNMSPLVNSDSTLNQTDFLPAAWQSYQWDGGMWALPESVDVTLLSYDPAAFDKVGLSYPDANWTIDDIANAVRKLVQKDSSGKVIQPGILNYNSSALFRSLLGASFYDANTVPNPPNLDTPELALLLKTWGQLQSEGVTSTNFQGDYNAVPLRVDQGVGLGTQPSSDKPRSFAVLPGGKAELLVDGFAVSNGTQYPDLAYALAKYMVSNAQPASYFYGLKPAKTNMTDATNAIKSTNTPRYTAKFGPENQAVINQAFASALPVSEFRYGDYINKALADMSYKNVDAQTVLQTEQAVALTNLDAVAKNTSAQRLAVATVVPTPFLKASELSLKFGLMANISPLPNRDQWDQVIKNFMISDPQVKQIVLDTGMGGALNDLSTKYDCFTLPYILPSTTDTRTLLDLAPLMATDTTFDKQDVIGTALTQLQSNNKTWGFPLYIEPEVLRYNSTIFTKAGLPAPTTDWRIDQFNNALKVLKVSANDPAPLVPREYSDTYLLMLIAAYGGIPLDFRTDPPTINFTDSTNVDAIRQVLDLAKQGYIKYQKLSANGFNGSGGNTDPIYTDSVNLLNFISNGTSGTSDPYKLVSYPRGTKYIPIAYNIGAAYISATAADPEACYRWISTIAKYPELFASMPARRSLIESSVVTGQGPEVAAFYKAYDKSVQDPAALIFSTQNTSISSYIIEVWLNRAFDNYVLQNADLANELQQAQDFAKGYQGCVANIPLDTSSNQQDEQAYYKQFTDCAVKIDPSLKSLFNPSQ